MNIQDMTSKQISDKLAENGIKMHFNSKREKLEEALNNLTITEGDNMEAVVQDTGVTRLTDEMIDNFAVNGVELEGLREQDAMKLIRVIVRPNDPLKLESTGDVFTVGSNTINRGRAIKKFVPYNNEEGWHVPNAILENIKAAECQIFKKVTRNGQDSMEAVKIKAYNVEELPALTQEELTKLGQRQKSTGTIG
jgi:hypothetical protein